MSGQAGYINQRQQLAAHQAALEVHQTVLQKHAELHQVQARAREALRAELQAHTQRPFWARLRWFVTGT